MIVYNFRVLASILRDIFNFLPDGERKKGTEKKRKKRRDQDVKYFYN